MKIDIINKQSNLSLPAVQLRRIVKAVIHFENVPCDEVAIHLVDTEEICALHAQFFNDPTSTDCISFPMDGEMDFDGKQDYTALGDVFVCTPTAIEYAAKHNSDPYYEVTLYIVHGLLHLMGYDDIDDKDRKKMRAAEKRHITNLKNLNLCLHD